MDWRSLIIIVAGTAGILLLMLHKLWLPSLLQTLTGWQIRAVWRDKKYSLEVDRLGDFPAEEVPSQAALLSSQKSSVSYWVTVINQSRAITDAEVAAAVSALQTQVHRDFAPIWGVDADLSFAATGHSPAPTRWSLIILDDADLGPPAYRGLTKDNLPQAKVFAATALQNGFPWTHAASHVLLEMLLDPRDNRTVFIERPKNRKMLYTLHICNPCQLPEHSYHINGIVVSDFVYPEWFEPKRKARSVPFDHRNLITAPFQILPGGNMPVFNITSGGWELLYGKSAEARKSSRPRPSISQGASSA